MLSNLNYLIDAHCHAFTYHNETQQFTKTALEEAFANHLHAAIMVCTTAEDPFDEHLKLLQTYQNLFWAVGYHPDTARNIETINFTPLKTNLAHPKAIVLGEIGLDYSYAEIGPKIQQQLFNEQLELAKQFNKPVMLHIRDAHEDALAIIKEQQITRGVVHCFTGNPAIAKKWLDAGFYLSFSGITTFKKALDVSESATFCPLERLFCETDAPFLAPVPFRGKTNTPSYVYYVYEKIAALKELAIEELAEQVIKNFNQLYGAVLPDVCQ